MVDWLQGDEFGIIDIDTEALRDNLTQTFQECKQEEDRELEIELVGAYVVGSVARNTAKKGTSDVDIVVRLDSDITGNMDPKFDLATSFIADCMEDNWKAIATPNMMKWITRIDIITMTTDGMTDLVWRFGQDTRTGEKFDSGFIYDIFEGEYYK